MCDGKEPKAPNTFDRLCVRPGAYTALWDTFKKVVRILGRVRISEKIRIFPKEKPVQRADSGIPQSGSAHPAAPKCAQCARKEPRHQSDDTLAGQPCFHKDYLHCSTRRIRFAKGY